MRRLPAMAVTSKNLRSVQRARGYNPALPRRLHTAAYGVTLLLAVLAVYALVAMAMSKLRVAADDLHYGRPRTAQIDGFVGHGETPDRPTHLMAINLNRQIVVVEMPG